MEPKVTQIIIDLLSAGGNLADVNSALSARRDQILKAIEAGEIQADSDAIKELAEINVALGDA